MNTFNEIVLVPHSRGFGNRATRAKNRLVKQIVREAWYHPTPRRPTAWDRIPKHVPATEVKRQNWLVRFFQKVVSFFKGGRA